MRKLFNHPPDFSREQKLKEFEVLSYPLMDHLYSAALRMTKNLYDAEDLVQNTYLKSWRFLHKFETGTNFRGWIFRILINNYSNLYQRKKRAPYFKDFETTCVTFRQENTREADKNREYGFTEHDEELFDDEITAALDKLPQHYRMVILLSDVSDLEYKEIAEVLELPLSTVMSRLSRGRKILARSLKKYAATNGFAKH